MGILLALILFLVERESKSEKKVYIVEVNRLHNQISADFNTKDLEKYKDLIHSYTFIHDIIIFKYGLDDNLDNFLLTPVTEISVILPINSSDFYVKYIIKDSGKIIELNLMTISLFFIVMFLYTFILLFYIYKRYIKPIVTISEITQKLTKGYVSKIEIDNNSPEIKKLLWGLDMIREKMVEQKSITNRLEKERKTVIAGISHDIKTPLAGIKNYSTALMDDIYDDDEEKHKIYKIIQDKVEIIDSLTTDLLNSSMNSYKNIHINKSHYYANDIYKLLEDLIYKKFDLYNVEYQFNFFLENKLIEVDMDRITEVFDNITENIIKYGDLNKINVSSYEEDNYLLISIDNSGQQIPEKELKFVFNSFYRGSNISNKPGYGLGLYIIRQIMRLMDGDVYIENSDIGVSITLVCKIV